MRATARAALACLTAAIVVAGTSTLAATAAPGDDTESSGSVAFRGGLPDDVEVATADIAESVGFSSEQSVPPSVQQTIADLLESGDLDGINTLQWDTASRTLAVHYFDADLTALKSAFGVVTEVTVEYIQDLHDRDLLAAEASRVARSYTTPDGRRIASAGPNAASTGIEVSVVVADGERPDLNAIARTLEETFSSSVPITVVPGGSIEPTSRNVDAAPWKGGARISTASDTPGFIRTCSTGWAMGIISVPPNFRSVMLIADHCSGNGSEGVTGVEWHTGHNLGNTVIGSSEATERHQADLQFITIDNQAGGGAGLMFIGAPGANTVALVKGAINPVIGDYWCNSGAESGTVCGVEVVNTEQTICFSITQCYDHQVRTEQVDGISSAGNGDSGGPSGYLYINTSTSQFNVFGAGVISGMQNASWDSCEGNPGSSGGRECSDINFIAPLKVLYDYYPGPIGILVQ